MSNNGNTYATEEKTRDDRRTIKGVPRPKNQNMKEGGSKLRCFKISETTI